MARSVRALVVVVGLVIGLAACGGTGGGGMDADTLGPDEVDAALPFEDAFGSDAAGAVDALEARDQAEADAPVAPFDRAACLVDPACGHLMVAAHRGHHTRLPENSIAGLRSAARLGVDFVEIDVRHTADGALVLMHDGDVDRTTNGTGAVDSLTFAEIEALTLDGADPAVPEASRVPTFAQALDAAREEGVLLYIDQKTSQTADVVATIEAHDAWDLAMVRDDLSVVAAMARDEPRLRVMPAIEGAAGFELALSLIDPLHIVEIGGGVNDPELVAAIRARGVKVQQDMLGPADVLGAVGNFSGWKRAVDAGVTLPQTDFPGLLVSAAATFNATGVFPASGPGQVAIPATLGGDRPAALIVPGGYDASKAWPLVMLLHGYGVTGALQSVYLGLPARADAFGFVLIVPDGTVDSAGFRFWNASPSCCNFDGADVDDVAYLRGLLAEAKGAVNVDPAHVALVGHSNGGYMAFRMACDAADEVTAIATIAGSMSTEVACAPSRPVSVLVIHGTDDADVDYAGGSLMGVDYLGAEALVHRWVASNECAEPAAVEPQPVDYDKQAPGAETTVTSWTGCAGGVRVDFWKMQGSPHIPPFTTAAKDAIVERLLGR